VQTAEVTYCVVARLL